MAKAIYIEGRRNGYAAKQCGKTMTVGELIDFLSGYSNDTPVYLKNDGGYTFGNIDSWSFETEDLEDEEDEEEEEDEDWEEDEEEDE